MLSQIFGFTSNSAAWGTEWPLESRCHCCCYWHCHCNAPTPRSQWSRDLSSAASTPISSFACVQKPFCKESASSATALLHNCFLWPFPHLRNLRFLRALCFWRVIKKTSFCLFCLVSAQTFQESERAQCQCGFVRQVSLQSCMYAVRIAGQKNPIGMRRHKFRRNWKVCSEMIWNKDLWCRNCPHIEKPKTNSVACLKRFIWIWKRMYHIQARHMQVIPVVWHKEAIYIPSFASWLLVSDLWSKVQSFFTTTHCLSTSEVPKKIWWVNHF